MRHPETRNNHARRYAVSFAVVWQALVASLSAAEPVNFDREVRPLLADKCLKCHGPDSAARKSSLRLDQEAGIKEAFSGGDFAVSEAWQRMNSADADEHMPPAQSGKSLSAADMSILRRWMETGAKWGAHWAFIAPERPADPAVKHAHWARNPIDLFVVAAIEQAGASPSDEATKETLIRRLSFDLTGLPPTPSQIDEFLADTAADAYERLVDRLLASPRYGERMAADWLDGARYADTNGYQNDFERTMWPWRDWVIEAFNTNMPFDRFVTEQLAGDLLPDASLSQQIASGFHRNHRTVTESGSIDEEWRVENVVDRVETTGVVFLGLTLGCARCHDHKYDPISQQDFYRFFAFFNSVAEQGVVREQPGNVAPILSLPNASERKKLAELEQQLSAATNEYQAALALLPEEFAKSSDQASSDVMGGAREAPSPMVSIPLCGELTFQTNSKTDIPLTPIGAFHSQWVPSFQGRALALSGDEGLELGQAFDGERSSKFACAFWVKPEGGGAVISKMDDERQFRGFDVLFLPDGTMAVHLVHHWPQSAIKVQVVEPLAMRVWSQIVMSYDGSSRAAGVTLYVNGAPRKLKVLSDNLDGSIHTDQPLRIGRRSKSESFHGRLRDIKIFDCEVQPDEAIALLHASLAEVFPSALQGDTEKQELQEFCARIPGSDLQKAHLKREELRRERSTLARSIPTTMTMADLGTPRTTFLLKRGRYDTPDKSQPLTPAVLAFLPSLPADGPRNRLALAQWVVAPENPLTARVAVNRMWQSIFGVGLVKTVEDFGVQAEPPSHPELLDWLATEFRRGGWNVKAMRRLIVTSATYRQSSNASDSAYRRDPENRLLTRGPRQRLPAEMIRDSALSAAGLLTGRIGGPSVKPYQPDGLWDELAGGKRQNYDQSHGADLYRRSLYTYRKRTVPHPTLTTFDTPSWEVCQVRRAVTNTPLQALALLNDTTYAEAARKLAERTLAEGGPTAETRIPYAFRLVTSRFPTAAETATLKRAYAFNLMIFQDAPNAAANLSKVGESPGTSNFDPVEIAAYSVVTGILLNLDEAVTKE